MPIQAICRDRKVYPKIVLLVMLTLWVLYSVYAFFIYMAYGSLLIKPLILENLP